jgi:hypothetical protein
MVLQLLGFTTLLLAMVVLLFGLLGLATALFAIVLRLLLGFTTLLLAMVVLLFGLLGFATALFVMIGLRRRRGRRLVVVVLLLALLRLYSLLRLATVLFAMNLFGNLKCLGVF